MASPGKYTHPFIDPNHDLDKDFAKISVGSPKIKNPRVNPKIITKSPINNAHSPKSPKVKSITDKGNTNSKPLHGGIKPSGINTLNRKSPKNDLKTGQQ